MQWLIQRCAEMQVKAAPEPVPFLPHHAASQAEHVLSWAPGSSQMTWLLQGLMVSLCLVTPSKQPHGSIRAPDVGDHRQPRMMHLPKVPCAMRLCQVRSGVLVATVSGQSPDPINSAPWLSNTPQPESSVSEKTPEKCGWLRQNLFARLGKTIQSNVT